MLLLGFGNKARHGKDTAAESIKNYYEQQTASRRLHLPTYKGGLKIGIFKYAAALYEEVNAWLKVTEGGGLKYDPLGSYVVPPDDTNNYRFYQIPEWVKPDPNPEVSALAPYGKHPKLLQWWGTEYRRAQDPEYWVKKTFANIPANLDIAMITDVRFPNEATAVNERGGYTVNVQRLRTDGQPFYDNSRPADHPSETALDGWNWNFYLKIPDGHAALTGELAVTLAEYLRGLK